MSKRRKTRRTPGAAPAPARPVAADRRSAPGGRLARFGLAALLCAAVLVGYLPALDGGFIFDDPELLSENALINADDGLRRFWLTTEAPDYWPLMSTTFWVEWRLWGATPTGYHVTNLVLHTLEALLLWAVLGRLHVGGAYLAALVFAVHPVNVQSVAWIAQRKNLVALLFFLLATLLYLKADDPTLKADDRTAERRLYRPGAGHWYWLSVLAFVLAMLGKGSAAVLPAVLLLVVWWQRRRVGRWDLARVAPFAVIAAGLVLVNIWFQTHGSGIAIRSAGLAERLAAAGAVVWFYLGKALLPIGLLFIYPQWHVDPGRLVWWVPLAAAAAVTLLLLRYRDGWARPFLLAWAYFCVCLLPVMGFTDVYFMTFSLVADHYQHIALIGVATLAAAGWSAARRRAPGRLRPVLVAAAAVVVGTLTALTARQSALYEDADTLYRATLEKNPDCWILHYNLGVSLSAAGQRAQAVSHLREALRARPDFAEAHNNLAIALSGEGKVGEALSHAEQALALGSDTAQVRSNLGLALAALGRDEEALAHYAEAVRLEPGSAEAHNAYGTGLMAVGRDAEAISELRLALGLRPDDADLRGNLAQALMRSGRPAEAMFEYERALQLEPRLPEAHYNLGLLLAGAGRRPEAVGHFEQAVRLRPDYAEARNNLAVFFSAEGRLQEALEQLEQAVRIRPDFFEARVNLAEACARSGRFAEAASHAGEALRIAPAAARPALERKIRAWHARGGTAGA